MPEADVTRPYASAEPAGLLSRVGPLRVGLAVLVVLCLPLVFFANAEPVGWRIIPVYVAPTLVVILIWLLLFDLLMSRVLMSEKPPEARGQYRLALRLDGALLFALLAFWGPFFYALLEG